VFESLECRGIRSDNGSPFAIKPLVELSRLSMWWLQLGIDHGVLNRDVPSRMDATNDSTRHSNRKPLATLRQTRRHSNKTDTV